jgi:hypothetical protein
VISVGAHQEIGVGTPFRVPILSRYDEMVCLPKRFGCHAAQSVSEVLLQVLSAGVTIMTTMRRGGDFAAVPELGYEEWRAVVRSIVGRYNPESIDINTFAGKVDPEPIWLLRRPLGSQCSPYRADATGCAP